MRTSPTRNWRGVSAEDRRSGRRARLVEAGLEVIGTQGWAAATVRSVCREAGLTERYFYESFADRDALLVAVYEQVLTEGIESVLRAVAEAPRDFRQTVRAAITAGVDLVTGDRRKGRVLVLEATSNESLQRRRQEGMRAQATLVSELARDFLGERAPDPADAEITSLAMVGTLAEVGGAYLEGRLQVSRQRLIDHLSGIVVAAATVSSAQP
ncbi:TetR/AcrR family transcriptional regulator [Amycolatopsis cihanbeyliensis]|uniref:TetR family transcriptional regulator n=1 Tax=Amycolatopsis cihanbeyliensis TaxID=1128664 RepID=A0A542DNW8_AMYCI|nr:TetR/AcrR family transcriptional regulator [Amycolatopsis cihanbeyliensis]TQJ04789.1 TetR family transcriptional regulator [Amycolatopsis cihanbeyliensis]